MLENKEAATGKCQGVLFLKLGYKLKNKNFKEICNIYDI